MSIININGIGITGSNNDMEPSVLPINAWTNVKNVRSYNGQLQSVNFPTVTMNVASLPNLSTDHARAIIGYQNINSTVAYASNTNIYLYAQGLHVLATSGANTIVNSVEWDSLNFNNSLVFSNPDSVPQILTPDETMFVDMPEWGLLTGHVDWFCEKMTSYKNFLVALNMTEDGVEYKQRVRWSDVAGPNLAPSNWDAGLVDHADSLAGFNDLSDATGSILTGLTLNDTYYIYTDREIFAMQFVGGTSIFSFRKINGDINCYNKNSVIQYKNSHIIISRDNVYQFNGTQAISIIDGKIRDKLFKDINEDFRSQVKLINHPPYNEVWILYPNNSSQEGECNSAAVFNSVDGTWIFRDVDDIVSIANVQQPSTTNTRWDDINEVWVSNTDVWFQAAYGTDILLSSDINGDFNILDFKVFSPNSVIATMERKYIDFDELNIQATAVKRINAIYPHMSGNGTMKIYIGVSNSSVGPITWETPKPFIIGEDNRVDFRVSGQYISIRFVMSEPSTKWIFTGYSIDLEERFNSRRKIS